MTSLQDLGAASILSELAQPLADNNLKTVASLLEQAHPDDLLIVLERLAPKPRAVAFRLLPKNRSLYVFEKLMPRQQREIIEALQDAEVAAIFADLDPDDRVWLLDELPASVTPKLLRGLSPHERDLTAAVLGYPSGSIGRRMSPEYVSGRIDQTVGELLQYIRCRSDEVEAIYTIPIRDPERRILGVVGLRDLWRSDPNVPVRSILIETRPAYAIDDDEIAARRCADQGLHALPIADQEGRLVGILTIDDAVRILEMEESEDAARLGGSEPLRTPYLVTPILTIVRARAVWLLVLAIGATLTVHVLTVFESTLDQVTVLALFVPLLIGTGGNTGNQAATTVTRALALGDIGPRDLPGVLGRELRVGVVLGALLGSVGFVVTALIYDRSIGAVIGLTLLAVCTMAASTGGVMPLIARAIRVDPAVFSNPFITTFVDALGLVIYFLIARTVLGL